MKKSRSRKRRRIVPIGIGILVFIAAFSAGVISKFVIKPSWAKAYSVKWSGEIGTLKTDLPYGEGEASQIPRCKHRGIRPSRQSPNGHAGMSAWLVARGNKFDLYLPKNNTRDHYGLVVYLHAGGFTSGDKSGDRGMLSWLCKKGYIACGINYTLRTETNTASVLSQSNEIKAAIPYVIEAAEKEGYHIDKMAVAGGSAGHTLAMLYAYRDAADSPLPVVLTFGAVGPSSFRTEDWDIYGLDRNTEEGRQGAAGLYSAMLGEEITAEEIGSSAYIEKMKPVSAANWVSPDSPPTVVAYGTHDRVQPFKASLRLKDALEENGVDYQYFECAHSGHGLQNDNAVYRQWMETVEKYLDKYLPVD